MSAVEIEVDLDLVDDAVDVEPDDPGAYGDPTLADLYGDRIVHDLASAEWAVRKLARARARYAEAKAFADAERFRLDAFLRDAQVDLDDAEAFFGRLLADYHSAALAAEPRRKSIGLPSGTLKARKAPDRVVVVEPEDEFVCRHGFDSPLVRVKASPDLRAIRAAVLTDGEALEGVEVVVGEVRFTVDTVTDLPTPPAGVDVEDAF